MPEDELMMGGRKGAAGVPVLAVSELEQPSRVSWELGGRKFALVLVGIVVVGVVLRVVYAVTLAPWPPPVGSDAWFYHLEANLLAGGRGFISPAYALFGVSRPTAAHPPLYPMVLAGLSELGGTGEVVQRLAGSVFGAGMIVTVGVLARRLVNPRAGLIAAGLAAVYPMLVTADGALMSETLYGLLIALFLLAVYRLIDAPSTARAIVVGVPLGLGVLTRGEALLLVPLVLVPLVRRPAGARAAMVAGCVVVLVLAPWTIRNWVVFGRPVPVSTNLASAVAGSNCASTYFGGKVGDWDLACVRPYPGNEAVAFDRAESHALGYAARHLTRLPIVFVVRLARVWGLRRNLLTSLPHLEGRSPIVLEFGFGMFYLLVPLAA
jgi:4-amino-4-deoxy-L-arabinose transferase-like glycosyltransferase